MEGPSNGHDELNNSQRESKLELFGFDSLVNKLGLKRFVIILSSLILYFFISIFVFSFISFMAGETV